MKEILKKHRLSITIAAIIEAALFIAILVFMILYPNLTFLKYILVAVLGATILFDLTIEFIFDAHCTNLSNTTDLRIASVIGDGVSEAYDFAEVGIAVATKSGTVVWMNEFLEKRMFELLDKNIYEYFPNLLSLKDPDTDKSLEFPRIEHDGKKYEVQLLEEATMFVFKDVTNQVDIYTYNQKQSPVVGFLEIDNYADVKMSTGSDAEFMSMYSEVNNMINDFANISKALIKKLSDSKYIFITTNENYTAMLATKFSIVEDVSRRFPRGFTISIGIGLGLPDYNQLSEMASSALSVALSRGGDQTVISKFSEPLTYVGGRTDLMPTRNRVKIRTQSDSFITVLSNYTKAILMGHETADFDAIGSCLAVREICKTLNINSKICYEDQLVESNCRLAIEREFTKEEKNEMFISLKDISTFIDENTLLIMLDNNDPTRAIFKDYVKKFDSIAIVDHHRPATSTILNPEYNGIDTSSSSTCEIITNYIIYSRLTINIEPKIATFLLTGICLDTHFFKDHATDLTFEVASQLKTWGANSDTCADYLKEDYDEYRQKIDIIGNSEMPYYGVMVICAPDSENLTDTMISIVADEAKSIRDVQASFSIARIDDKRVKISGRSDGSFNVSLILEKMGGGGRFAAAAAIVTNATTTETKLNLLKVLDDYIEDARIVKGDNS